MTVTLILWSVFLLASIGAGMLFNTLQSRKAAKLALRPELTDLQEVLESVLASGDTHMKNKIEYAVVVLHELTD